MGVGAGLYMCDVVKKFTFAISSPDEFLCYIAPVSHGTSACDSSTLHRLQPIKSVPWVSWVPWCLHILVWPFTTFIAFYWRIFHTDGRLVRCNVSTDPSSSPLHDQNLNKTQEHHYLVCDVTVYTNDLLNT